MKLYSEGGKLFIKLEEVVESDKFKELVSKGKALREQILVSRETPYVTGSITEEKLIEYLEAMDKEFRARANDRPKIFLPSAYVKLWYEEMGKDRFKAFMESYEICTGKEGIDFINSKYDLSK